MSSQQYKPCGSTEVEMELISGSDTENEYNDDQIESNGTVLTLRVVGRPELEDMEEVNGVIIGDANTTGDDGDDFQLIATGDGVMTINMEKSTSKEINVEEEEPQIHECDRCSASFNSIRKFKIHLNICRHVPILDGPTEDDEVIIIDMENLDTVCFCCNEEKPTDHCGHIKCNFCPKSFKSHVNLKQHLYTLHSTSKNFRCTMCNATCPSTEILDLHIESHQSSKPFSCQNCGKGFTRKYHLDRHLRFTSCDKSKQKEPLKCTVCEKMFSRMDNLREHLRCHMGQPTRRKDYECPYCEKSFYGSALLNIHIRTHTGERPFGCDLCDKVFPSNGALRKHRRTHTGEKPYTCPECARCFSAKETLNRHMKIHTGVRPHVCDICNIGFIQQTQLKAHVLNHTGSGDCTFECSICNVKFSNRSILREHLSAKHGKVRPGRTTNSNLKDFECEICNKQFGSKPILRTHIKTHMTTIPSQCKICLKTFKRDDLLVKHMKQKHSSAVDKIISEAEQKRLDTMKKDPIIEDPLEIIHEEEEYFEIHELDDDNEMIKTEKESDELKINSLFLNEVDLKNSIQKLLAYIIDKKILTDLGSPYIAVETLLSLVIDFCGHTPADEKSNTDVATKLRENVKILLTSVINLESVNTMLNNHTIDEVILHVLQMSKEKKIIFKMEIEDDDN